MKRLWWMIVIGVAGLGVVVIVILLLAPKNPVPGPVRKQLSSTLFVPREAGAEVDRQSVKYDGSQKLLTYNVTYAGTSLVVSEQPTPEQFIDIPDVYKKLVD